MASSGTAEAVAHVAHALTGAEPLRTYNCFEMSLDDVHASSTKELVRHRTAAARAKVPGLEPGRADIAVAGALILETVGTTFGIESFTFSEAALRDGVLVDTFERLTRSRAGRRTAACTTCATCPGAASASSPSAATTTRPTRPTSPASPSSCSTACVPLHDLDGTAREYLEAGALLANVGLVVAHSKHHLHAYYVIRNSELAGLTDLEIEIIAQIARYHRKSEPKPSHAEFAALDADDQDLVRTLAAILRVAIGLDRSHRSARRVGARRGAGRSGSSCSPRRRPAPRSASSSTPPTSARTSSSGSPAAASSCYPAEAAAVVVGAVVVVDVVRVDPVERRRLVAVDLGLPLAVEHVDLVADRR